MSEYSVESMLNLISEEEYDTITHWRKINLESSHNLEYFMPSRDVLRTWAYAKKDFLAKLFNGKLILHKIVKVGRDEEELCREFTDLLRFTDTDLLYDLKRDLLTVLCKIRPEYSSVRNNDICSSIFKYLNILNNKYDNENIALPPNEYMPKGFKITHGSKIMKLLRGLMKYFGYDESYETNLEHIMISQSQVNNSRYVEGELAISIHPLDYMTMSDNRCNWSSCMSWEENGCYRQGTIEMMNSPKVVIAYLEAKDPMKIGQYSWNNKKWRQLFIVDPNAITGVKGYPYRSDELAAIVIDWLADLANQNLNWHYKRQLFNLNSYGNVCLPYKDDEPKNYYEDICFNFVTEYMYNDFGSRHLIYLGENCSKYNEIPYSGLSQCMCCGATNINLEPITSEAGSITCPICNDAYRVTYCEDCGTALYNDDDMYYLGDTVYCEDCYYQHASRCIRCGDYQANEDMTPIGLIYDKLAEPIVAKELICSYCLNSRGGEFLGVKHLYKSTEYKDEVDYYVYDSDRVETKWPWGNYYPFEFADPKYVDDTINLPSDLKMIY